MVPWLTVVVVVLEDVDAVKLIVAVRLPLAAHPLGGKVPVTRLVNRPQLSLFRLVPTR